MDHEHAITRKVAEQYVFGELSETDANAFEEHFFDCGDCAEDVRDEMQMLESGRDVVRESTASPTTESQPAPNVVPIDSRRRGTWWIPAAAAAMLVVALGVPTMMRRDGSAPSMQLAHELQLGGLTRAESEPKPAVALPQGEALLLYVDVAPQDGAVRYDITVRAAGGKTVGTRSVTSEQTTQPVALVLSKLPAGTYEVVTEGVRSGGMRAATATQSFTILSK
jgi:anti-sigma factor RsiW